MLVSQSDYTPYRRRKSSFDIRVIATLISLLVIILTGLCVFSVIALRLYYTHHDTITSTSNRTAEYGYLSDGKTQVGLGNSPCSKFAMNASICVYIHVHVHPPINQLHLVWSQSVIIHCMFLEHWSNLSPCLLGMDSYVNFQLAVSFIVSWDQCQKIDHNPKLFALHLSTTLNYFGETGGYAKAMTLLQKLDSILCPEFQTSKITGLYHLNVLLIRDSRRSKPSQLHNNILLSSGVYCSEQCNQVEA